MSKRTPTARGGTFDLGRPMVTPRAKTGNGLVGGANGVPIGLAPIADGDVLANVSGASAAPGDTTPSELLDYAFGAANGAILYRGAATWAALMPGTAGYVLETEGAGADPQWAVTVSSVGLSMPADFVVSGSPVTASGTLTAAWANQAANLLHAGPASGAAAAPTWRALVPADLPAAASYQGAPQSVAPSSSTSQTMGGFAGSITPKRSGTVLISFVGYVSTTGSTAGQGASAQASFGAGSAPAANATLAGTQSGAIVQAAWETATAAGTKSLCACAVVTGLTVGATYWLDIAVQGIVSTDQTIHGALSAVEL